MYSGGLIVDPSIVGFPLAGSLNRGPPLEGPVWGLYGNLPYKPHMVSMFQVSCECIIKLHLIYYNTQSLIDALLEYILFSFLCCYFIYLYTLFECNYELY